MVIDVTREYIAEDAMIFLNGYVALQIDPVLAPEEDQPPKHSGHLAPV